VGLPLAPSEILMLESAANPFALMMDPQSVLQAIEHSQRLERLHSRICRPLDKPLIPKKLAADLAAFDRDIDRAVEDATE
jgi:hypothetical protein